MTLPTNLTRAGLGAAGIVILGGGLAWVGWGGAMFSPGALSSKSDSAEVLGGVASHAKLGARCTACHASLTGAQPMSVQCLDCHTDTQADLRDSTTLHGGLDSAHACLGCHTEHGGPTASLVRFGAGAGNHARFGFALDAHRKTSGGAAFRCADCHRGGSFKFDAARCESCHREYQPEFLLPHVKAWGSDCRSCHDGTDRFSRGRFSHDTTAFKLQGAHQPAACASCHVDVRTLAAFGTASGKCVSCHLKDDDHKGEFGTDCSACHGVTAWKPATLDHKFPLDHGEGGRVACKVCHAPGRPYRQYTCYGCHEHSVQGVLRKHQEEGISGARLNDCVRCHATGREHEGGGNDD